MIIQQVFKKPKCFEWSDKNDIIPVQIFPLKIRSEHNLCFFTMGIKIAIKIMQTIYCKFSEQGVIGMTIY